MSKLLESKPNAINSVKTTQSVSYQPILKELKEDAATATKEAKAVDANAVTIASLILDTEAARAEADRCNIHSPTVVGTKEGFLQALRQIVGKHITDKIAKTSNSSNNVSIDNYSLHDIMQCAIKHATRPEIDDILALMGGFYNAVFDFQSTINQNMLKLKEDAARIK